MIVLQRSTDHAVALFGCGLIGSAVRRRLEQRGFLGRRLSFAWTTGAHRAPALRGIERCLGDARRVGVLWSAGAAGFGCDEAAAKDELDNYRDVLGWAQSLPAERVRFILVSSAGGIHEGQVRVDHRSPPGPLRPYGLLKLAQEEDLGRSSLDDWRIVRPASVFGPARPGLRRGLIPSLLANGMAGRVTRIFGGFSTLRDYVWAGDLGRYLAGVLCDPAPDRTTRVFATGVPTSLLQVKAHAEKLLRRRVYVACSPEPSNARHMSYRPECWPAHLRRQGLLERMARVHRDLLGSGATPP